MIKISKTGLFCKVRGGVYMLTYAMEDRGDLSLYEYLYRCIRQDILSGALAAGERLPSKRALAEHLHLSVITVEGAYAQLEAEGYVYTKPKQGFFVCPVQQAPEPPQQVPIAPEPPGRVWKADLGRNQADASRFPAATWARLTRQVLSEGGFLTPAPHQGLYALRQAIADDLRSFKGMAVSPEQIVIGAGAEYLYILLAQLLGPQAVVAVEDPGYPKIRQVYGKCGAVCRPIPLDRQGMDPAALAASGATAAHISPNHHYPTGIITTIGRRQALLRWAEEQGAIIIEDDYDSEFRFNAHPMPAMQSMNTERVIYMNSFSKTLAPSIRISYMVLPRALMERFRGNLGFYSCTVSSFEQYTLARFLRDGHFEKHINRMRKFYRSRRNRVVSLLESCPMAEKITILEQDAGLHFLVQVDTAVSDEALTALLAAQGIRVHTLSEYYHQSPPEQLHCLVVNYSSIDEDALKKALETLEIP